MARETLGAAIPVNVPPGLRAANTSRHRWVVASCSMTGLPPPGASPIPGSGTQSMRRRILLRFEASSQDRRLDADYSYRQEKSPQASPNG